MNKDKGELTIIGLIIVVTAIILAGLYIYDKGQSEVVDVAMDINGSVQLKVNKVTSRPGDRGQTRLIFDATSTNLTKMAVDFHATYPTNPCSKIVDDTEYYKCQKSANYTDYLKKYDEISESSYGEESKLRLMEPNNAYCTLNESYMADTAVKNIGYHITEYYQSSESKTGVLVFDCSQSKGAFTLIYKDQQAQINI